MEDEIPIGKPLMQQDVNGMTKTMISKKIYGKSQVIQLRPPYKTHGTILVCWNHALVTASDSGIYT